MYLHTCIYIYIYRYVNVNVHVNVYVYVNVYERLATTLQQVEETITMIM